jgi:hypothetical protein
VWSLFAASGSPWRKLPTMSTMTPIAPQRTWGGRCGSLNRTLVPTRRSMIRRSLPGVVSSMRGQRRLRKSPTGCKRGHAQGTGEDRCFALPGPRRPSRRSHAQAEAAHFQYSCGSWLSVRHRTQPKKPRRCRAGRWHSFSVELDVDFFALRKKIDMNQWLSREGNHLAGGAADVSARP